MISSQVAGCATLPRLASVRHMLGVRTWSASLSITQCGGKATGAASPSAWCIPTSSNTLLAPRFCGSLYDGMITWQAMKASGHRKDNERLRKTVRKIAQDHWGMGVRAILGYGEGEVGIRV